MGLLVLVIAGSVSSCSVLINGGGNVVPVSYTHLDVYKRQVSFLTAVYASVPDGEAVRRVRVRKEAAHAEYP